MAAPTIGVGDLPPHVRKKLGLHKPRAKTMTKDQVRSRALDVLAVVTDLTQVERRRVLQQALKVNEV